MFLLVQALDKGDLDSIFGDVVFMERTEDFLLAMLRGEPIEVADPNIFSARNEIFAAAQVIYNHGNGRGFWESHLEIQHAMSADR